MIPTVGRMVHYMNLGDADGKYPPEKQAAIITHVVLHENPIQGPMRALVETDYVVDLHIFYRTGDFKMFEVPFSAEPKRGHWSWPPRVG